MRNVFWILVGTFVLGCEGKTVEVGPGAAPVTVPPGTFAMSSQCLAASPPAVSPWPDPHACAASSDSPVVGSWDGYVENQPPPWDKIRLVIYGASDVGSVCGTMTFGTSAPPPPPTDPDVGWPSGFQVYSYSEPRPPIPGVAYSLLDGRLDGSRVRFSISSSQAWEQWCELQPTCPWGNPPDSYSCLPNAYGFGVGFGSADPCYLLGPSGSTQEAIDCLKLKLCWPVYGCQCSSSGCTASRNDTAFDLHFEATQADGGGARFTKIP